jgi:nicotinamide phosphoribosyltransferase
MLTNRILATDSYKFSHAWQYPPGTTEVSAYIETRAGARFKAITSFGLQMFLKEQLSYPVTKEHIDEAEALVLAHGLPFNRAGWEIVLKEHDGMLPLEIQALPEGMTVPLGTPLVQVRNTDPRLPWLTTFVETALLRAVWYPSTVATVSRQAKKIIYAGLQRSSDDPDRQIPFKLHDFGARGVTSGEQAALGGCAHLVNFMGTDTVEGLVAARRYYGAEMAGFSIPAAEHSTITAWGRDGEIDAYRNMLTRFGGKGKLVAVVSDSYDVQNAVRNIWGGALKSAVIATEGTLVVRPDSGDPTRLPVDVLKDLANAFGTSRNAKGYLVLNPAVRVIQGDGMNLETIEALVRNVIDAGFSIDNIAFGMGGGLLQKLDRDTMRFAMKANEIVVGGQRRDVSKAPVTDPSKASKAGRLAVVAGPDGAVMTVREASADPARNLLAPVWRNGRLLRDFTFDEVRRNAALTARTAASAAA